MFMNFIYSQIYRFMAKQDIDFKTRNGFQTMDGFRMKLFEEIVWDFIYGIHKNREIWIYRFKQNIWKTFITIFSSQIFYDNGEAL